MSGGLRQRLHVSQATIVEAEDAVARAIRICEAILHPIGLDFAKEDAQRFLDDYAPTPRAKGEER